MFLLYILASLSCILVYYFRKKNKFWKIRGIPGPKPELLFGNIKDTALRRENMAFTLLKIYNKFPNEPIVGMYRMTSPCLLIRDLDIIKHVMIKDFDKFQDRGAEFSKDGLGANLFHVDGEIWRILRNKFSPLFTTGKLKNMAYLINERADVIMTYLDNVTTKRTEHEITKHLKRYTISTITVCAFGLEVDTISDDTMNTLMRIDKLILNCNIFHEIEMMFPGLLKKFSTSVFPNDVQAFFDKMVADVIAKRNGVPSGRDDFMDVILEMRQQKNSIENGSESNDSDAKVFTESVIAAQVFVFFVAGYETSSTILSYLLYELATHPRIQDKIIEEVDSVLDKHKGEITYEIISELHYMEKVFQEIYRKYPIIPLQRKSNVDYKIPGTNYTIEKDTMILLSAHGIHYDEKYYPDPDKFDPERFSSENIKNRHSCAYLPYGVGPRNCIGIRFGKLQTRIFAIKFFSKYRVESSENTKSLEYDPYRITTSPLDIYLNFVPRKKDCNRL